MAQIVQGPPSLAERLGTGLGSGLQQLSNLYLNKLLKQQQLQQNISGLQALGYTPEQAQGISQFEPDILKAITQERAKAASRSLEGAAGLRTIIPGLTEPESKAIASLTPAIQAEYYKNFLQSLEQPVSGVQALQELQQQMQPEAAQQFVAGQPQAVTKQTERPLSTTEKIAEARAKKAAKLEEEKKAKEAKVEQLRIDKDTKKYYEDVLKGEEAAKQGDIRLNRMEELIKKGNLPYSTFYNLFKNLEEKVSPASGAAAGAALGGILGAAGGPLSPVTTPAGAGLGAVTGAAIGGLISPVAGLLRSLQKVTSPDLEEFEKLSADFVKFAKDFFPGRVTDADLKAFFQSIPTLSQTDAGKSAIIKNMKSFNDAAKLRAKAMKDIIKENNGKRPDNLPILVEEKIAPQLDKLSQQFIVR